MIDEVMKFQKELETIRTCKMADDMALILGINFYYKFDHVQARLQNNYCRILI
jgi:hypothetical protein